MILIAVALFAALSYAVTTSSRSGSSSIDKEQQELDQAVLNNCETAINMALMRLKFTFGCDDSEINYELPDGTNSNLNAPTDGHCNVFHPSYGMAVPCGSYKDCDVSLLQNIGDECNGIVYAGNSLGYRLYTSTADHSTGIVWATGHVDTAADDQTDGLANTDHLLGRNDPGISYNAAQLCRTQGEKWYLPALNELALLQVNKAAIGGFSNDSYWTSTEPAMACCPNIIRFLDGYQGGYAKTTMYRVRCVRQD